MKVFVFYPPGELFQRGEDRCQANVKSSTANDMRACNDLGYMASVLRNAGDEVFLKDYATEKLSIDDYYHDIISFSPDVLVLSTTNTTVFKDIDIINETIAETPFSFKVILKGAIFYDAPDVLLNQLDLRNIDVLIGGEAEWVIGDVVHSDGDYRKIPCIIFKNEDVWIKTDFEKYNTDLDSIPFPARDLMNNALYVRPDTGEPMATIQTGHGCPSNCIYCLTPQISGKKVRLRSPENVLAELLECYNTYNIRNFFFRADTFTINREWVLKLCSLIKNSPLNGKIEYTANSRVRPLSIEVLKAMKETGCFMIAFGFETGSSRTMELIKKGATIEENENAVRMAKEVGIPICGFFMMGFPWEQKDDLKKTREIIYKLDCDFIEIHVALPFYGTVLYDICKEEGVLNNNILGRDVFHATTRGTKFLSSDYIMRYRRNTLLRFYLRPKYIIRKMLSTKGDVRVIRNYIKYGIRLVFNQMIALGGKKK